jgi:hypothetical protein
MKRSRGVFLIPEGVGNGRLVTVHYLEKQTKLDFFVANEQTFILQARCFISPIKVDLIPEKNTL